MLAHKFFIDFTVYITVISSLLFVSISRLRVNKIATFINIRTGWNTPAVVECLCILIFAIKYVITAPLLYLAVYFYQQDMVDHPLIKSTFNFIHSMVNYFHALINYSKVADVNISKPTDIQSSELVPFSDKYIKALDNWKDAVDEVDLQLKVIPKRIQNTIDSRHILEEAACVKRDKYIADLDQMKGEGKHVKK